MRLDFLDKIALTFFAIWIGLTVNAHAGEWNEKPVMCEQKEVVQKLLRDKGEVLLMSGIQLTKVRDPDEPNGYSPIPATLPLQVFVNLETKTFSITELHPTYNSICIIAYGENFSSLLLDTM